MKIALLAGDGIGPEILREAKRVLEVLRKEGLTIELEGRRLVVRSVRKTAAREGRNGRSADGVAPSRQASGGRMITALSGHEADAMVESGRAP